MVGKTKYVVSGLAVVAVLVAGTGIALIEWRAEPRTPERPSGTPAAERAAAAQMTYVEYRYVSPKIAPGSFEGSLRKVWRSGTRYVRIEEELDPQRGTQEMVSVDEPNIWMWNRVDNKGKHLVDPGPTYNAHVPIFSGERSPRLDQLEIGRESAFFDTLGATEFADTALDGIACTVRSLTVDNAVVTLYARKTSGVPLQLTIVSPHDNIAIRYEIYEPGLPFDPSLFAAPSDVALAEPK